MVAYIEEAAGYIRVSTQEQKTHGLSLDAQKQKLEEYAEKHNIKIVEWYIDEGVSGRKLIKKRPQLQRMVLDAQKGRFKRILFIKLDRFFRSVAEYHECMKLIEPVIWTATEEKYDLSTANGRAFVNMKLTIAELEADQTGERIKIVNEYKVHTGMPLYGTQSLPFCFAVAPPKDGEKHKTIVKVNEEAMLDLIDFVFLNKSVRSGMSYINNKYGLKLRYNAVTNVLRNEMICGSYRGNPNYCPAFITRERFEELQQIVGRTPRTSNKEHSYIFTGLIACPHCGCSLGGHVHTTSTKYGKYTYYAYRCRNNRANMSCDFNMVVFENRLEKLMLDNIERFLDSRINNFEITEQKEKVSKVSIEELQQELERLNYSWQKGRIKTVEEYDTKYEALMNQIAEATQEITQEVDAPDYNRIKAILTSNWQEIYKALDTDHKRAFWRSIVKEIHIDWTTENKAIKEVIFF